MTPRVLGFLFHVAIGGVILWCGFEHSGRQMPGLSQAPWFWCLIGIALVLPMRYWWWSNVSGSGGDFDGGFDD